MPRIGYARSAPDDPEMAQQIGILESASCYQVVAERSDNVAQWRALLSQLTSGDVLVVARLDRVVRSLRQLLPLVRELAGRGVAFEIWQEGRAPIESDTRRLLQVLEWLVELEGSIKQKIINEGLTTARTEGQALGRRVKLDPAQVSELLALMSDPNTDVTALAKRFGISRVTAYKYVRKSKG
jgi:DNA invertase Pin-like site-specific DNA recombinase